MYYVNNNVIIYIINDSCDTLLMIIMIIRYSSTSICWIKLYWIVRNGVSLLQNTGLIAVAFFTLPIPQKRLYRWKAGKTKKAISSPLGSILTPLHQLRLVHCPDWSGWVFVTQVQPQCPPRQRCNQKSNNDCPWAGMNNFFSQVTRAAVFWDPAQVYHHSFCSFPPWHSLFPCPSHCSL